MACVEEAGYSVAVGVLREHVTRDADPLYLPRYGAPISVARLAATLMGFEARMVRVAKRLGVELSHQ